MEKLVLIDGNAIIHRAYHALPKTMSNRRGEQTNAVYGFTTTIIKVLEDLKPKYLACSFDLAGPTFRHEAFTDYKATRVKADQDLYDQIPRVKEIVQTMNIPIYEKDGFEADDCLGTIVDEITNSKKQISNKSQITNSNIQIYIVSGDKDIYQLINENVFVYSLRKGLSQMQVVDHETIQREYNLDPLDFIDLKALAGDSSDNIPGVPGIGAKTATKLLQDFDTLEKLYQKIESFPVIASEAKQSQKQIATAGSLAMTNQIKPRILDLLIKYKDQAFLSQHLATIHRDVPINFDLEKCRWGEYDKDKLKSLFEELGFQSLLRRFDNQNNEVRVVDNEQVTITEVQKKDEQLKLL
ncbi:MAG: 5'-3' exonuclease H3TH domain-containing protein [Candidatus Berkelbacteria bacterium]